MTTKKAPARKTKPPKALTLSFETVRNLSPRDRKRLGKTISVLVDGVSISKCTVMPEGGPTCPGHQACFPEPTVAETALTKLTLCDLVDINP